jgi:hypothetical protein
MPVLYPRRVNECMDDYYDRIRKYIYQLVRDKKLTCLIESACEMLDDTSHDPRDERICLYIVKPSKEEEFLLLSLFSDLHLIYCANRWINR